MSLSPDDRRHLAEVLTPAVRAAGDEIMKIYSTGFTITEKADQSPVTEADQRAETIILDHLARFAPGVPVIAEEAHAAGVQVDPGEVFFLVDPLDGTREFINHRDEFTVNIGLVENGIPILGLVFAPALGRLFRGSGTGEAVEITAGGRIRKISARLPPASGRIAIASRSHRDPATESYLAELEISEFISAGSSMKFCILAAGEADIYPRTGPTREWDTAAGHAVLLAAGGGLSGLDGGPFKYGKAAAGFLNSGFLAWGAGPAAPPAINPA